MTSQDRLEEYKKAVRVKYEIEKSGDYSSFLFNPSRAKLRDLCSELFKQNLNAEDLKSFNLFFGFEYKLENLKKLRNQKDKFRPIENFFKGETDLSDIEGINIASILVDFKPRPFSRFIKQHIVFNATEENSVEVKEAGNEITSVVNFVSIDTDIQSANEREEDNSNQKSVFFWIVKNKLITIFLIIVSLLGGFSLAKFVFTEKQCMQWQNDRYEVVDCINSNKSPFENDIIPLEKSLLDFRRVEVSNTTVFFNKSGKPLYWYCKVNGKPEFFNSIGDGRHPETGNVIKPVTHHIVNRYIINNPQIK